MLPAPAECLGAPCLCCLYQPERAQGGTGRAPAPVASGGLLKSRFAVLPRGTSCYFSPLPHQGWTRMHVLHRLFLEAQFTVQLSSKVSASRAAGARTFSKQGPSPRRGCTEEGGGRVLPRGQAGRRLPGWEDTPTAPEPQPGLGSPLGALSTHGAAHGHQGMSVESQMSPPSPCNTGTAYAEACWACPAGTALWRQAWGRADKRGSCSGLPPPKGRQGIGVPG